MKKLILIALSLAAVSIKAQQLEDVTILINVRSSEPVTTIGALPLPTAQAPAAPCARIVQGTPPAPTVVYSTPVVYNGPVYNGPVVYNPPPIPVAPPCGPVFGWNDYSYYDSHPCHFLCNPNLIRFGEIQAAREGYYFSLRR